MIDYIKEHLKIEIEYTSPAGLCDGKIKATLKLDEEVIDVLAVGVVGKL